ncbi:hypothetical protein [Streptomyces sp. NPDC001135]
MLPSTAYGDSRLSLWLRVRRYAVPPSMIELATGRRVAGDWAGACAAARIDVDLDLRSLARSHGREMAARLRADLRHLAPDLLRWHMPRVAPDGLLRPGLTLTLARYARPGRAGPLHLVARTPPSWADAGQRISLAVWDPSRAETGGHPHPRPSRRYRLDLHRHLWDARRAAELRDRAGADGTMPPEDAPLGLVPPVPGCAVGRWAAEAALLLAAEDRSTGAFVVRLGGRRRLALELVADAGGDSGTAVHSTPAADSCGGAGWASPRAARSGDGPGWGGLPGALSGGPRRADLSDAPSGVPGRGNPPGTSSGHLDQGNHPGASGSDLDRDNPPGTSSNGSRCMTPPGDLGGGPGPAAERRCHGSPDAGAHGAAHGLRVVTQPPPGGFSTLPVLPDAATWTLPDLELLRAGLLEPGQLHPLVAAALAPGLEPAEPVRDDDPAAGARLVECRGATHRIGLVDGVLAPLDHDPAEIRREELLAALGGPPLPCLRAVDEAHRRPDCLAGVRDRLDHGDTAGALAVVEGLLGPGAVLRDGPLRDELAVAAERRINYGLYRAGLMGSGRTSSTRRSRTDRGRRPTRRQDRTVTFF